MKQRNQYETPTTTAVEVKMEGMVCSSPDPSMQWLLKEPTYPDGWGRQNYDTVTGDGVIWP